MKKGQIISQVFVYMLVLFVVGIVAVIGTMGVGNLLEKQCLADISKFKGDFAKNVYDTKDLGEAKIYSHRMPCSFNHICFFDPIAPIGTPKYQSSFIQEYSDSNNVFLVKAPQPIRSDMVDAFNTSKISLTTRYKCFNATSGRLRVLLEGNGKRGTKVLVPN